MSDLSPELDDLVSAGRSASRPTEADFHRVLGLLQGRLGPVVSGGEVASAPKAGGVHRVFSGKVMAIATASIALTLGGVAVFRSHPSRQAAEPRPAMIANVSVVTEAAPVPSAAPAIAPQQASPAAPVTGLDSNPAKSGPAASTREQPRSRDSLSEEVAILSRAETELHSGRPEAALKTLSEHERRFPRGILKEERIAARIQALCALGRGSEANGLLARLKPGSLHGETSRQACAPTTPPAR